MVAALPHDDLRYIRAVIATGDSTPNIQCKQRKKGA
nr:MAG TPA: hypothetical protein [Caudoviricetes sp.]